MGQPQLDIHAAQMEQIRSLRSQMRGQVLCGNEDGYDAARSIHNGMIDHRPAVIAQCHGAADVIRALGFARNRGLPISIRGGGHGVTGFAVCDAGVMIDLSRMNAVRVDPFHRTARAGGGAIWGDFDDETQAFGLATTGGLVRTTGIAGLTLAGGHGFLVRRFGLACDNLISADIVTAEGQLLAASDMEQPDLFWALRGGGGNFGIVTSFQYRLHTLGPVLGGLVLYPMSQVAGLLLTYDEFLRSAPDELGALAAIGTLPDGTKAGIGLFCYSGEAETGERLLAPIRAFGPPMADQVTVMPYTALQSIVENFNPRGLRNYWKTVYVESLSAEAIRIMFEPGFPDSARLEVGGGLPAWRGGFVSELPLAQKSGRRARRHVDGAAQPKIRHSDRPPLFAVGSGRLCYSEFYFFKLAGGPDWTVCSGGRRHAGNHFRTDLWTMKSGSPNCSTPTCPEGAPPF